MTEEVNGQWGCFVPALPAWSINRASFRLCKLFQQVLLTTVKKFDSKISHFLCKWLGLPQSLSSIALYRNQNKLQLPFSSLSEEFMVTWARVSSGVLKEELEGTEGHRRPSIMPCQFTSVLYGLPGLGISPRMLRFYGKREIICEQGWRNIQPAGF